MQRQSVPVRSVSGRQHSSSYYTLAGRLLHQFGGQQGMLGGAGLPRFGNEQTYFLIGSSPLRVQLAVVAEGYLRRKETAVTFRHHGLVLML